jgi:hypothetical protein
MAHFAEIDPNGGTVLRVLVVPNEEEHRGQDFLANELGLGGVWIQTSYNGNIRKNYAGVGYTYDSQRDAFIPPQPYPSWTLVEETCNWTAPVLYPTDGKMYQWDEATINWIQINEETP